MAQAAAAGYLCGARPEQEHEHARVGVGMVVGERGDNGAAGTPALGAVRRPEALAAAGVVGDYHGVYSASGFS